MNVGDKITIEIYPEMHCDECFQIIHNHIDCPICDEHTSTDAYHEI